MKTLVSHILLSAIVSLAFACNKKDDKKADEAGKPTTTDPTPPPVAADAAPATPTEAKEVPTAQDFEDKAAAEVTKENLEAEVEKLEKEITAEEGAAAPAPEPAPAPK
jgi:hypothetical protein